MSSDEEDYMSDAFLAKCGGKGDIRPGLIKDHSARRQHEIMKRKSANYGNHKSKSVKILEIERRDEGLNESLSSSNKGFKMLQKMGYKSGQGIGKQSSGTAEPIPITIKNDRSGLGRESVRIEIAKIRELRKLTSHKFEAISVEDFRKRLGSKMQEKHDLVDLSKSQKICQKFDIDQGINEPDEVWFWRELSEDDEDEEKEVEEEEEGVEIDEEFQVSEKLSLLTSYLRQEYFYCVWCAVQFYDYEDLTENCPGSQRQDH